MEILIKPRNFTGCASWQSKLNGVILVEKEADIEPLWKLSGETVIPTGKLRQALKSLSRDFKADLMLVDLDSKPEIIDF